MSAILSYNVSLKARDYPTKYTGLLNFLDPYIDELVAAREGQASLLANNLRYVKNAAGLTQDLPANGFRITGLPVPVAASEPATKSFAEGLAFSSALPAQAGNVGKEITTDGANASWGITSPGALAVLNMLRYFG